MPVGNADRKKTEVADNGPFEIQRAPEGNNRDDTDGGVRYADLKLERTDLPTDARSRNMWEYNVKEARPRVRDTDREKQPSQEPGRKIGRALCNRRLHKGGNEQDCWQIAQYKFNCALNHCFSLAPIALYDLPKSAQASQTLLNLPDLLCAGVTVARGADPMRCRAMERTMHEMIAAPSVTFSMTPFVWNTDAAVFIFKNGNRNLVERFFNKIKQCRRVATRYDKLAANHLAFIQLASIRLWLHVLAAR